MRRIVDFIPSPGYGHPPVFERLAQRIEETPAELGDFIAIEHAVVRQADFTRSGVLAAADHRDEAGAVMRSAERTLLHQSAVHTGTPACHGVDLPRLNGFFPGHRRQDGRQAGCHQALAAARCTDQNDIVSSRSRDFHAPLGQRLSPDLPEIIAGRPEYGRGYLPPDTQVVAQLASGKHLDGFSQRGDAIHSQPVDFGGFLRRFGWEDTPAKSFVPRLEGHGEHTVHGTQPAVQRQLSHDQEFVTIYQRNLLRGGQHSQRDGQVVSGTFFSDVGRRQVHHDLPAGDVETIGCQRRDDTQQAFPHGAVGQPNQMNTDSDGQIDLHRHNDRLHTDASRTITLVQHRSSFLWSFRKDKTGRMQ